VLAWVLATCALLGATSAVVWSATSSGPSYPVAELVRGGAAALGFGVLGALVATRRPEIPAGWLMLLVGLSGGVAVAAGAGAHHLLLDESGSTLGSWAYWVSTWSWVPSYTLVPSVLLMALPSHVMRSRWWRGALWFAVATNVATTVAWAITPYDEQDHPVPAEYGDLLNPIGLAGGWTLVSICLPLLVVSVILAVASLAVRLRHVAGHERDQVLYILAGGLATAVLLVLGWFVPGLSSAFIAAALVTLPLGIAAATVRKDLWELDLVVNRTLVLLALSGLVLLVYALVVAVAGGLLQGVTRAPDLLAFVVAAVLVQPLRDWLQRGVNRFLYGDAVEPHRAVAALGRQLHSVTSAADLLPAVVDTVASSLRLDFVELTVPGHPAVRHGERPARVTTLPLVHQDREVGWLAVGGRVDELGRRSRGLLDELVRQAALAAHTLRLQEELQISRERIVTSREEERRRLRHDLHDDLGPGLAATAMQLESAASQVHGAPERACRTLAGAAEYLRSTVGVVRRIVDDLRPAPLDDFGLEGAVREHASRLADGGLRVTVETSGSFETLPAAAEVAAFRIAAEAMTNVARHAGATSVRVGVVHDAGLLEVQVSDDGAGLRDGSRAGVGLGSMHQRAAELGGSCTVTSDGEAGTTVRAIIPTRPAEVAR
jgi:signal transduction histidine kinase